MQLFIVAVTASTTVAVAGEMPFGCFKNVIGGIGIKVGVFFSDDRRDVRLYIKGRFREASKPPPS